jgi:HAD superfamily hydrolase (TIGR01549 family)
VTLTLLLDLDNTLLENNIESFLPHYLGIFSKHVAPYIDPNCFVDNLLLGTRAMVKNRRPDRTLQEVFEEVFYTATRMDRIQFTGLADQFYAEIFPTLRSLTRPRPEAVQLVEQALARGYRLAITTNPLFPRLAMLHRLAWAGLPVEKYPFELITSYETFHFAKPDAAYYAEVLSRLGWPSGGVLMVGDDLDRDIAAARQLGVPAFWLASDGVALPDGLEQPTNHGELGDIIPWLDQAPAGALQPDYTSPSAKLATLRSTPAVLDSLCRHLPAEVWKQRPFPGEWSLIEVLCHLRDVDQEVNLERVQKVLLENNPFLPGKDTDPWAVERCYIEQEGLLGLQRFTQARLKLLEMLEPLPGEGWQLSARHAIFGPTRLFELVDIIASHDRLHIQQVQKVLEAIS